MFRMDAKVRFSESGYKDRLTCYNLFNYLQDTSTLHSEQLGETAAGLREENMAWVLSFWQVCIERMPKLSENITVSTWPYQTKGLFGMRNFCVENEAGFQIVKANSIWVLVDARNGKPIRITDEVSAHYPDEPKLEMNYCDRKLAVPESYEEGAPIVVQKYFLDANRHVNNAKYVMIAEEYLPEDREVREIRVEYKKAAVYGDVIIPRVTLTNQKLCVVMTDTAGKVYAIAEFIFEAE